MHRMPGRPRATNPGSVLHQIVQDHLETLLAQAARLRDGDGLPPFVERAFRDVLRCRCLPGGFARFRCGDCGLERLVPFSSARLRACLMLGKTWGLPISGWVRSQQIASSWRPNGRCGVGSPRRDRVGRLRRYLAHNRIRLVGINGDWV